MTALDTAVAALRRAPADRDTPITISGEEAAALVAELTRLRAFAEPATESAGGPQHATVGGVELRRRTAGSLGIAGGPGDEYRSGPTSAIAAGLDAAIEQREATPGRPEDGPYPASVGEVADEVARWIDQTARKYAPGLAHQVVDALGVTVADELRVALRHIRDLGCEYTALCRADSDNERGDLCRSCYADDALDDEMATPPADLPATLATVDDVHQVCVAAGLTVEARDRSGPKQWFDTTVTVGRKGAGSIVGASVFRGPRLPSRRVCEIDHGNAAVLLWHAIQAARSTS